MMPMSKRICVIFMRTCSHRKFLISKQLPSKYLLNCYYSVSDLKCKKGETLIKPQSVKKDKDLVNVGSELVGNVGKDDVSRLLHEFFQRPEFEKLVQENELDPDIVENTKISFLKFCGNVDELPTDLHVVLWDLLNGHGHVLDIFPYFLQHSQIVYPHLKYKEELSLVGNLTDPANCYPLARSIKRKLIFHYGPTNSGKTYSALTRFFESKKGVYCAPLKILATEVYTKANKKGVKCDLVTGDDCKKAINKDTNADHVSCTVEMVSLTEEYDVAVIDEIQMIQDTSRGYAWTRALLGLAAKEIHLCGEESAVEYIKRTVENLGETLECIKYKRLTNLFLESKAIQNFKNIQDGDCIICFSKKEVYGIMHNLEKLGKNCCIVYGTLPPVVKAAQTDKFNDPSNKSKVLIATDAVGLGINLNIRRIIFYSLFKGPDRKSLISCSLARQIAGRAGRYQSRYPEGFVTTFKKDDLETLKNLLRTQPDPVRKAGLCPTVEQIELFSYYLPGLNLSELLDIFMSLSKMDDSRFFLCDLNNVKRLADQIKHLPLSIKTVYNMCNAPVNVQAPMHISLFVKIAKKYALGESITAKFMKKFIEWPLRKPENTGDLVRLEQIFDCLDLYLWFAYRYPAFFPDVPHVKDLQSEVASLIMEGITCLLQLFKNDEKDVKSETNIAEHLIEKGILTPELLAELRKEWSKQESEKLKNNLNNKKTTE